MQYYVDLGEILINPQDQSTWHLHYDWDALQNTDGTKITALWARPVAGTAAITVRYICPTVATKDDGSPTILWDVQWTVAGGYTATWQLTALVSDQVTQPTPPVG